MRSAAGERDTGSAEGGGGNIVSIHYLRFCFFGYIDALRLHRCPILIVGMYATVASMCPLATTTATLSLVRTRRARSSPQGLRVPTGWPWASSHARAPCD